jgi:hypothetical protein
MRSSLQIASLTAATLLLPMVASAQVLTRVAGVFNIIVGLMLVAAILTYGTGMILWFTRLGVWPSHRDEAIGILEWSVAILFMLVVLLGFVHFVQKYAVAASFVFGVIIVLAVIWFILTIATAGESEDEH